MFYRKYYYRRITAQGLRKTLSKNYGARLAQGPLQSLKALDPDLLKPDFEAPEPRDLKHYSNPFRTEKNGAKRANDLCKMLVSSPPPRGPRNRSRSFSPKGCPRPSRN
jgi:hypothetical protein